MAKNRMNFHKRRLKANSDTYTKTHHNTSQLTHKTNKATKRAITSCTFNFLVSIFHGVPVISTSWLSTVVKQNHQANFFLIPYSISIHYKLNISKLNLHFAYHLNTNSSNKLSLPTHLKTTSFCLSEQFHYQSSSIPYKLETNSMSRNHISLILVNKISI